VERKRKSKKERTKEKLFKTAVSLFLEKGYENTTVQEITEKADVAKGTFFRHFPTKDAVLTYLGAQRLQMTKEKLMMDLANSNSAKQKIVKIFQFLAEASEADKTMTKLISYEIIKKLSSPEFEKEEENLLELKHIFVLLIEEGQQKGEFKTHFQANHVADILIGIYFYTLLGWLAEDHPISLAKEYTDRVSIVLEGIAVEGK